MGKHLRTDAMRYVGDFPKGQEIVLVYPHFGDIVRWVPVVDEYGYDQHDAETFPFVGNFTEPGKHREIIWSWPLDEMIVEEDHSWDCFCDTCVEEAKLEAAAFDAANPLRCEYSCCICEAE